MPVKWSAKAVLSKLDEIERVVDEARPILQRCMEMAKEIQNIPNVPQYIQQPTWRLEDRIAQLQRTVTDTICSIRNNVPEGAAEIEGDRGDQPPMLT